jgi:hypothetical protein
MDLAEQGEAIIDMIDGLTDQDIQNTYNEWSKLRYEKSLNGQTEALADLQSIATKHLLKRLGKWDSYVQRATSRKDKI